MRSSDRPLTVFLGIDALINDSLVGMSKSILTNHRLWADKLTRSAQLGRLRRGDVVFPLRVSLPHV